jgi:hypothetical protein
MLELIFWVLLGTVVYTYAGYPLVIRVLNLISPCDKRFGRAS